jgi:hypothetical protein
LIPAQASVQLAHSLLSIISRHKLPTYRLFYQDYRTFFSIVKVPPVRQINNLDGIPMMVDVDCKQAVEYLKHKFNFYDSSELTSILQEEAEHHGIRSHT